MTLLWGRRDVTGATCRFEGCVNTGNPATFRQGQQERQTMLCAEHLKRLRDAIADPTRVLVRDRSGRLRVDKAPPILDHESEGIPNVFSVLDKVAEVELARHTIQPHGTWTSDIRAFMCTTCNATFAAANELVDHLNSAVDAAVAAALKAVQESKE
jgi:hypothetical protein